MTTINKNNVTLPEIEKFIDTTDSIRIWNYEGTAHYYLTVHVTIDDIELELYSMTFDKDKLASLYREYDKLVEVQVLTAMR